MFWTVVACSYYYLLCTKITDFEPVKKVIQAIFFFVTLLIIVQLFGKDTLLNFNQKDALVLGTIGNYMILGSFICILAPFLIQVSWLNWIPIILIAFITKSSGTMLSVFAGLFVYTWIKCKKLRLVVILIMTLIMAVYAYKTHDFDMASIRAGRFPVWKRTIELANKKPFGFGIATYRLIFPLLSQDLQSSVGGLGGKGEKQEWEYENTKGRGLAWRRAHNCFTQILFEVGWTGFLLFIGFIGSIAWCCRKDALKLAGLTIIGMNMFWHFPTRLTQAVLIMLMYLAFCKHGGCNAKTNFNWFFNLGNRIRRIRLPFKRSKKSKSYYCPI
jgi:O-antigen ligase